MGILLQEKSMKHKKTYLFFLNSSETSHNATSWISVLIIDEAISLINNFENCIINKINFQLSYTQNAKNMLKSIKIKIKRRQNERLYNNNRWRASWE